MSWLQISGLVPSVDSLSNLWVRATAKQQRALVELFFVLFVLGSAILDPTTVHAMKEARSWMEGPKVLEFASLGQLRRD